MDDADGESLLARLRETEETPLSRLGSSKALYAVTDGEMTGEAVRAAAADDAAAAATLFDAWAAETTGPAADVFADAAARAADHHDVVTHDGHQPSEGLPLYDHLATLDGDLDRAAGLLGRAVVVGKRLEQTVGFFVGDADPQTAELFRSMNDDLEAQLARAGERLEAECETEADWERAREAATGAIRAAYDAYTDQLESMGVNPKPDC